MGDEIYAGKSDTEKKALRLTKMKDSITESFAGVWPPTYDTDAKKDKYVKETKHKAENARMANDLLNGFRAGSEDSDSNSKFQESLTKYGVDINDHYAVAKRKKEAETALVDDVVDTEIDITDPVKRENGRKAKIEQVKERMKAIYGKKAMDKWKKKSKKRGTGNWFKNRTPEAKKADDNELKNSYEKSTGETNVPLYKIKKRMRDAAKESAEVLDVMTDASDCKASNTCKTELQKKIEFKAKIKEITGEEPNEVETTSLLKDICDKSLLATARLGSQARGKKQAKTREEKKQERKQRREAWTNARGREPASDAEVKKSLNDAVAKEASSDFRECVKSGKSKIDCITTTKEKMQEIDENLDEMDIKRYIRQGTSLAGADLAKECNIDTDKTSGDCLQEMATFLKESRGETKDVPEADTIQALKEGSRRQLASIISECTSIECKIKAKEDFKQKTLDPTVTDVEFEEEIEKAAAKEGLEISKGCNKYEENCTDVMMESYRKSSGREKVTKSEAVAAIKSAGRNDLANTMRACLKDGKTYATCRPLVRQKLRQSKSWDNSTKTKTEVIVTNDENEKVNCALVRVACPSDHPCCAAEVIATNDENENDDAELERE